MRLKHLAVGHGTLFDELGFSYVGPIDGHRHGLALAVLRTAHARADGPGAVHVLTKKGKGYAPAESARDKGHGVSKFDVVTGAQTKGPSNAPSYTDVFADALIRAAETDRRIVAVTAAMPDGTGLNRFTDRFARPLLRRGHRRAARRDLLRRHRRRGPAPLLRDLLHRSCSAATTRWSTTSPSSASPCASPIDRAGLVGADGATHAGSFDVAYLATSPASPSWPPRTSRARPHGGDRRPSTTTAPSPSASPAGEGVGVEIDWTAPPLEIGRGRIVREGSGVALLSFGTRLQEALAAAESLACAASTPPSPTPASPSPSTAT
jgi:1-deoxy-D-xylulose-5-phosphate synthase